MKNTRYGCWWKCFANNFRLICGLLPALISQHYNEIKGKHCQGLCKAMFFFCCWKMTEKYFPQCFHLIQHLPYKFEDWGMTIGFRKALSFVFTHFEQVHLTILSNKFGKEEVLQNVGQNGLNWDWTESMFCSVRVHFRKVDTIRKGRVLVPVAPQSQNWGETRQK